MSILFLDIASGSGVREAEENQLRKTQVNVWSSENEDIVILAKTKDHIHILVK